MSLRLSPPLMCQVRGLMVGIALGATALLMAACSSEPASQARTPDSAGPQAVTATDAEAEPTFVTATLTEFAIELTAASAPAGPVMFQALNSGAIPHELVVVRTDLGSGALPIADGSVDLGALDLLGEIEDIAPTNTDSLRVEMTAGNYVLLCDLPGHYAAGMHTTFTVE